MEKAVNMLKNGKTPEEYIITAEFLKKGTKDLVIQLNHLIENI